MLSYAVFSVVVGYIAGLVVGVYGVTQDWSLWRVECASLATYSLVAGVMLAVGVLL